MELNDLFRKHGIDPTRTIMMRHRPDEPGLRKVLPWLVHERPGVFNAYQRSHSGAQEQAIKKLSGDGWIASFLGLSAGEAVFCGLYRIADCMKEWRGIYLIRDLRDGLAYVGAAYGKENLPGRWQNYATSGDGGNRLLKPRKPDHFRFSILERPAPDLEPKEVVAVENSWKRRLGTLHPGGLNAN